MYRTASYRCFRFLTFHALQVFHCLKLLSYCVQFKTAELFQLKPYQRRIITFHFCKWLCKAASAPASPKAILCEMLLFSALCADVFHLPDWKLPAADPPLKAAPPLKSVLLRPLLKWVFQPPLCALCQVQLLGFGKGRCLIWCRAQNLANQIF